MNNKGQMMLFGLMIMVFILATALALVSPMQDMVREFRTDRNCTNTSISTNEKALCFIVDMYLPYFIATLLIGSAVYVFYRSVAG